MPYPTIEDYPYLRLEIDTLMVTLRNLPSYSRKLLHGAKIDYAFSGNAFIKRTPHEAKHLWNVTVLASWEERNQFWSVVRRADSKIFVPPFDGYKIILSDVFLSLTEPVTTRLLADPFINSQSGYVEYFAKFLVGIDLSTIEEKAIGELMELSFVMSELEKLAV
jgi:hypothetical protein